MSAETLEQWLRNRTPQAPAPFLPHLLGGEEEPFEGSNQLEAAGAEGILRALKRPGRNRAAAFDLLAGDALLTYACEALAQEEDTGAGLELLLKRLGDRFQ